MHAFLVIGDYKKYLDKIKNKQIEFSLSKVSDVRELNSFTKLKVNEKTTIVLKDFDKASVEAQNAFLKSLEEPQENLNYVLCARNIDNVLPTITSRCEVVEMGNSVFNISEEERKKINEFKNAKEGRRLKILSLITKRDEAIKFMENFIFVEHEQGNYEELESALKTLNNLEKNGNVALQLTYFVINGERS